MTVTVTDPDFNLSELDWKPFRSLQTVMAKSFFQGRLMKQNLTRLSGSRFDPHPQRIPIFHLILGGRSES